MAITKKVKSPTGRPSKVNPAVDAFMRGEDTRGKRPTVKKVKPKKKRPVGNIAQVIRDKNRRTSKAPRSK
jgi:hypothetical protein